MRKIDPTDPIYKGLTKPELIRMKHLSHEEKEAISIALWGEPLVGPPPWQKQCEQRWAALLGEVKPGGEPYRVTHEDLRERLALARHYARRRSGRAGAAPPNTVAAFSDWIIRLYVPQRRTAALISGLEGENAVLEHRLRVQKAKLEVPRWEHQGWKLVHDGIRGVFEGGLAISSLKVGEASMVGVPDLVFRERKTGRVLIVELKVSDAILPSNGWPNLRAQLWAYSRIEAWSAAPEVLLAGEVWSSERAGLQRRATYHWRATDAALQSESRELFEAYGGHVVE
ncbi:MAG: hypothetical protein ROZ64_18500 [Burkholderiaceae bacterium]|jgi:hypothetical protein|nr:hypothetical protein [Burkholderiaceae bacterium]